VSEEPGLDAQCLLATQCSGPSRGLQGALSGQGASAADAAVLPKAGPKFPLELYTPISSGNPLMFLYCAISWLPVDHETVARS
jgi:hypothetical protein